MCWAGGSNCGTESSLVQQKRRRTRSAFLTPIVKSFSPGVKHFVDLYPRAPLGRRQLQFEAFEGTESAGISSCGRTVQLLFGQVYVLVFGQLLRHLQVFGDGLAALHGSVFYAGIVAV